MDAVKDSSHLYEVERRARHAERPGFRISELQISRTQQVPWHSHTHVQDTFYVLEGRLRLFLRDPKEEVHRFRAVQDRRTHLEHTISRHGCDVSCQTERVGSPHVLRPNSSGSPGSAGSRPANRAASATCWRSQTICSGELQFGVTPSASAPARRSICGPSAAR